MNRLASGAGILAVISSFALVASAGEFSREEASRIVTTARDESKVMEHLDVLCNTIGPRLTGSDNLQKACEWARDRFASYGLEARLEPWGEVPVGFNRGPWKGKVVEPEARDLEFITPSWTAGTDGPRKGPAVLSPTNPEELEKLKGKLKGAWVVTPLPAKGGPKPDPLFLKSLSKIYREAGAAGVIRGTNGELILTDGNYKIDPDALPTLPAIRLRKNQFDEIVGWLKGDRPVTLEFDIRNGFKKGPITQYNVIADLPGADHPDEYVIVGGHLDSWDGATGATDNGTGCATTIEAARILAKSGLKPRRTIRFMLWTGEEQGLLGSHGYVKAHPELMPKISAVLVHDGGTNYLSSINATEAMLEHVEEAFSPVVGLDERYPFQVKKVKGLMGLDSDHASFLDANVPGFFWGQAGKASYQRTHHTQHDKFEAANADYQKHSALVVALGSYGIAGLNGLLPRDNLRVPGMAGGSRRTLGVQLDDEMTVGEVIAGGVAEKSGVKEGDTLLKVDDERVLDRAELIAALQKGEPKKKVVVLRDGKEVELKAEWAPREKK